MVESWNGVTIKVVSQRTLVPLHTLRAWERRYGVPRPARSADNRYRLYDEDDIADVLWMKQQIEAGLSPSQAGAILRQQQAGVSAAGDTPQTLSDRQQRLQDALLTFDERAADQLLDESLALFSLEQVALQMMAPAMRAIGEQWMGNQIGIGQEHFASNVLRRRLLAALQAQPVLAPASPLLIAACAPEEQHELGLLIFSLLARRHGWRVTYLGQRTPLADLIGISRLASPRAVLVSVTTVIGLANLIPLLAHAARPAAPLYFGGRLFELLPDLATRVPGVYVGADPALALQTMTRTAAPREVPGRRSAQTAARAVRSLRMDLAARTAAHLAARNPRLAEEYAGILVFASLFLGDAIACALAFDLPAVMDAEAHWLREALPPRAVQMPLLADHLKAYGRSARLLLGKGTFAQVEPLLARMSDSIAGNGDRA